MSPQGVYPLEDVCGIGDQISSTGDSAGGLVEVIATGMPAGVGEPVFAKLDGELGKLMGIGAVKGVEIGAGFAAKDMTGYQCNDQMHSEKGKVVFDSNGAGGITGGSRWRRGREAQRGWLHERAP